MVPTLSKYGIRMPSLFLCTRMATSMRTQQAAAEGAEEDAAVVGEVVVGEEAEVGLAVVADLAVGAAMVGAVVVALAATGTGLAIAEIMIEAHRGNAIAIKVVGAAEDMAGAEVTAAVGTVAAEVEAVDMADTEFCPKLGLRRGAMSSSFHMSLQHQVGLRKHQARLSHVMPGCSAGVAQQAMRKLLMSR